jgi:hypothetical protein
MRARILEQAWEQVNLEVNRTSTGSNLGPKVEELKLTVLLKQVCTSFLLYTDHGFQELTQRFKI